MKIISPFRRSGLSLLLLAPLFLYSCQTSSPSGSPRKKMPEFSSDDALEGPMPFQSGSARAEAFSAGPGPEAFAFHTSNIDLESGGSMQGFVYVPLPDASNDSMAIALLHSYRMMALPMLNTWAAQQHQGVAIDLSRHNGAPAHRSDYTLEKPGEFSIPVVIIWDQASAARVAEIRSLVTELPGVTLTSIGR
ncbi:MAG TPA: hypothetical protein VL727_21930 [Puia sp.]|nr:hypothetical protein [Puia sp.]